MQAAIYQLAYRGLEVGCSAEESHLTFPWLMRPGATTSRPPAIELGAADEIRTRDLRLTKAALYQLSHSSAIGGDRGNRTRLDMIAASDHRNPLLSPCFGQGTQSRTGTEAFQRQLATTRLPPCEFGQNTWS